MPGVGSGESYKFHIRGADGHWRDKADPLAAFTEIPPATASRVFQSTHQWTDDEWMAARAENTRHDQQPMSIYEVHLGSWKKHPGAGPYTYDELAEHLTAYLVETGFTHVELLPVMEHPFGGSWGYQVTSYYAPTSRFGDPDGFRRLVEALHNAGIGVIVDWVPAHFPKDDFALARFDGTPLYEDPNPSRGEHPDWGTYVFNFGRKEVRNFLVANALYWLEEFHIDGIRVDAVASMIYLDYSREAGEWQPNVRGGRENLEAVAFLQELNGTIYKRVPGAVTMAEESTSWPGVTQPTDADGLGFGFKWNMGWMHDSLEYVAKDPIHRSYHHHQLTFAMVYAYSENYVLPISHDEVVHGKGSLLRKMPGDRWQQLANVRAFLSWQWAHPGKQLLFMGQEFAQDNEWAEQRELDWGLLDNPGHAWREPTGGGPELGVRRHPRPLVAGHRPGRASSGSSPTTRAATPSRSCAGAPTAARWCASPTSRAVPHEGYHLGLPSAGEWSEVINTDAEVYGGSGVGNLGTVTAHATPHRVSPPRPRCGCRPWGRCGWPARTREAAAPPFGSRSLRR